MGDTLQLVVGTRDGLYLFETDPSRAVWNQTGPFLTGLEVSHAVLDPRDGQTIYAAATGNGCTGVYRSRDRGQTWTMAGDPFDVAMIWHVEPGPPDLPGSVFAGTMPAGLYRSDDHGDSWEPVDSLNGHASREEWYAGGAGEIVLHRILIDPHTTGRLYAGISVAGFFRSDDYGASWTACNTGVDTPMPTDDARYPEVHRCIHSAVLHPHQPDIVFQQNHMGVYRSTDGGQTWTDISAGLHNRFGFVCAITHEPEPALFVVPQDDYSIRFSGQLTVYRSRDHGESWEPLTNGLPIVENVTLYREGMATDPLTPGGVYFGTSAGDLWASRDSGDHWYPLAQGLAPIRSVSCTMVM